MLPWYQQAQTVIAPIRIGCGTRLKVVEAWSVGRPLVATTMAVDGLDARHQFNCLLADDPQSFAKSVLSTFGTAVAQH